MTSTDNFQETDPQLDSVLGSLRGQVAGHVRSPGAAAVRRTVHRRRVAQRSVAGIAVLAVAGGVATAAIANRDQRDTVVPATQAPPTATASPSAGPAPTPSATPSATASAVASPSASTQSSLDATDWRNATLKLPAFGGCPARTVKFVNGWATYGERRWQSRGTEAGERSIKPVYADITGDGAAEALVEIGCGSVDMGDPNPHVLAFRAGAAGPKAMGAVTGVSSSDLQWLHKVSVTGKTIVVEIHGMPGTGNTTLTTIRRMTWNGSSFVRVNGALAILDVDESKAIYTLPALPGCKAYSGTLDSPHSGQAYWTSAPPPSGTAAEGPVGDLDGDGQGEQLMIAHCMEKSGADSERATNEIVVAMRLKNGKMVTLGTMAAGPIAYKFRQLTGLAIKDGKAIVTYSPHMTTSYRWNGTAFVPA